MRSLFLCLALFSWSAARAEEPLFNLQEILDASTLDVEVLQEWHTVDGSVPTRQKLIDIRVGELWPEQDYRVPVRMVVPSGSKAKGFHLTGGHRLEGIRRDVRPRGIDAELLAGGVGLVHTIVQTPDSWGKAELGRAMHERFIATLNPHYSIQYWAWPATLMRAATAAFAETEHFATGKVALSGGSKNGASPSVAIIHDKRMTALHAAVSPPWDSPLRLCDRDAWRELDAFNKRDGVRRPHHFLGGTFGPIYNHAALAAGHDWPDLQRLATGLADDIFVSRNLPALKARGVDLLFHPGTHDFVAFDLAWGGAHYPQIPVYLRANSGHGKRRERGQAEEREQNKAAFLLGHFFTGVSPLLEPPTVATRRTGGKLSITVTFPVGSEAESGRIWWMYDRGPDGSVAYIRDPFPADQWKDMKLDAKRKAWTVEIELDTGASRIDFFSNHRKTVRYGNRPYETYLSCPYTRVALGKK